MLHDYPDGHGGSGTFVWYLRKWPAYGVVAQQGLSTLHRLLEDRSVTLVTMGALAPRTTYRGERQLISALDRCVRARQVGLMERSGLLAIVAKIIASKADIFVVGASSCSRAR